ncbi:MAG: polysaccharide biosynthesis tyrosine autokinase [Williamsia sp.]|nr:polysaccharide biosynthesis tyrosine autokinase [Williamsia sp.]
MQVTHRNGLEIDKEEKLNLKQLWSRYAIFWPFYALLLVIALIGAWAYVRYFTVPLYESNARILLKDKNKGVSESKSLEDLNLISINKTIENEVEVIQSRTLITDVVKSLGLYAPIYEKTKIRSKSAYTSSPVRIEALDMNNVKPSKEIPFAYEKQTNQVTIANNKFPLNKWVSTQWGMLRFVPNKNYDGSFRNGLYFVFADPREVANDIQARLNVAATSKLSTIIDLTLRDQVPQEGEDILNELMNAYDRSQENENRSLAENTMAFVNNRLIRVARTLDSIENNSQRYKASRGAIDISTEGRLYLESATTVDRKLADVGIQLTVLDTVENYVRSKSNQGGVVPSTVGISDPGLSRLLNQMYDLELQYEKIKKTTGENNPVATGIADQIDKIRPSVLENIESQRKTLQASKANLNSTNNIYTSRIQGLPQKERELLDIGREQAIQSEIYTFLLKKQEETALSFASTVSDNRIVDRAQSSSYPVSPNKRLIYLGAAIASLVLGIGIIAILLLLRSKVMFRQEIEDRTAHPIIGEIAFEKSTDPIVTGDGKRTLIAEQFRKLRIALSYAGINSKNKKILVTSTIGGEGKSFVATNLAVSLAMTGKKVVLLELDLNHPTISDKLQVKVDIGITDYLLGKRDHDQIIKRTKIHDNLFIIPSGPLPENPSELLMNGRIQTLLTSLHGMFDYIIVDAAPVSPVTDAYILSPYCDVTLYVVRHRYTPLAAIEKIDENKVNQLHNVAIVFNGVRSYSLFKNNYYGYGYGYTGSSNNKKEGSKGSSPVQSISKA